MDLFIKKSNGFIKINKFSYPAIYHILNWSCLVMKATFSRKPWNGAPSPAAAATPADSTTQKITQRIT
ncbi:hypothetical protein [Janthinobacterium sp. PSPC3-1]|uniref:hypothetical protein n=1 Tax=Janthinobacterium sp. PSPC3-1 TaxID=2804653 RepID=UPI003CE9BB98